MFYFVLLGLAIVVLLVGVAVAVFSLSRGVGLGIAAGSVLFALIVTLAMGAETVDARSVGIQTSFGKYTSTLPSGFHFVAPWSSVEQFSTQVQYLDIQQVPVSFAGGSGGSVNATVRWTITPDKAENLWKKYRTFDAVRDRLVKAETQNAIAPAISQFSPVEAKDGANRQKIQDEISKLVATAVADDGVSIDSVNVTGVALDERAQNSLNRVTEATANIDRAKAEQERARIDNETAQLREASNTPQALTRQCLDVVNNWDVNKNGQLPATFDCGLGGDAQILVGAK
jgi:regulator of protease activity HflC (stomatin/prohibitin superfamily)